MRRWHRQAVLTLALVHSMKATSRAGVAVMTPQRSASSGILDLGVLSRAVVVARPSKSVKSPYVADVLLLDGITFGVAEETWIRAALEKTPKKKKEIDEHKARLHGLLTGLGPDLKLAGAWIVQASLFQVLRLS